MRSNRNDKNRLNSSGFTVIELIVSFSITLLVILLLFQLIINLKDLYVADGIKTELLIKQGIMTNKIAKSFEEKKIKVASKCPGKDNCLSFTFEDESVKILSFSLDNNLFHYGDYTTKLVSGSSFGKIKITNKTFLNVETNKNDSSITLKMPIVNNLVAGEYGIKIVYLYDSRKAAIGDLNLSGLSDTEEVFLKGNSTLILQDQNYSELGYYVRKKDGTTVENDPRVIVSGNVTDTGVSYLKYTLKDGSTIVSEKTRKVVKVVTVSNYDYTGGSETFMAPINGNYKIELWGAKGGNFVGSNNYPHTFLGGSGAYTLGTLELNESQQLYVYVGGKGVDDASSIAGGYNGGASLLSGQQIYGRPGAGSTDVRLINGVWNNFNSLKSRIMVAAGGGGANNRNDPDANYRYGAGHGGAGGTISGIDGVSVGHSAEGAIPAYTEYNIGTGGTQTSGGYPIQYMNQTGEVINHNELISFFGYARGNNQSGGGGGYYGGGASSHGGTGGGSSFISGYSGCNAISDSSTESNIVHTNTPNHYSGITFSNANMISGNASMPNPRGAGNITGNGGNGYARITLLSITS